MSGKWVGRGSRHQRGYGSAWDRIRKAVIASHPLCNPCIAAGRYVAATQVDHIKPKDDGGSDDWDNLQPICDECHAIKSSAEGIRAKGGKVRPRIRFDKDGRPIWPE